MFVSFGHKLRGLGNVRFGFRMKRSTGCLFFALYALFDMMWFLMLGVLWMCYGVCYLFFYLPIKAIVKLCKRKSREKKIADAAHKYTQE